MIRAGFNRSKDGYIRSFTLTGHAEFAEHGKDLVCAGASAVVFGSVNAVAALTGVEPDIELADEKGGYFSCRIPGNLEKEASAQIQLLLEGLVVSLQTIEADYGEYIQVISHDE
ncbi:ribosomal-processing cysteine protease Prp [Bacillus lacus]|uniref:Ribosomal processing cysteine protease Prp n=1 Tax=Metabacillus lacus TaxID=1983721 RepID=A0A7X2IXC7_9BACI|nr:ribosomal-processing cysteine protease Prp [Metabacillus lacus]MRX71414.1 ribosomal-processing cysteine protease Prp [Metabacillus lacus]